MKVEYRFETTYRESALSREEFRQLYQDLEALAQMPPISFAEDEPRVVNGKRLDKKPDLRDHEGNLVPLTSRWIEVNLEEKRNYRVVDTYEDKRIMGRDFWMRRHKSYSSRNIPSQTASRV